MVTDAFRQSGQASRFDGPKMANLIEGVVLEHS